MGGIISTLLSALHSAIGAETSTETLSERIARSPGVPQLNASQPYWTLPPAPIAQHGSTADVPPEADVVIIGSGITGTAVAKALLEHVGAGQKKDARQLKVVMLEARDACSGATGRNGGHIVPNIYTEYFELKKAHGAATAQEILRFRLAHISTLIDLAEEEGLLEESQARLVDDFDAYMHPKMFQNATAELEAFLSEAPEDLANGFDVIRERETIEKLQFAKSICGCILKPGASIHPYRLVTGLLQKLLLRYPNFYLLTRTPCTDITSSTGAYIVHTPRGKINTPHIVHATNAWSSHLLPGMRRKIVPTRLHMSAQLPGPGLVPTHADSDPNKSSDWTGTRGFLFYNAHQPSPRGRLQQEFAFDYLTQLRPTTPTNAHTRTGPDADADAVPRTGGEFMFGGGAMHSGSDAPLRANIGIADDSTQDPGVAAYLARALPGYFAGHWGAHTPRDLVREEGNANDASGAGADYGGVLGAWAGIVAVSADMQPWVGRVPPSVAGRSAPLPVPLQVGPGVCAREPAAGAAPGEWICAGYTGEGMVHAWLSGVAVARMVLGVARADACMEKEDQVDPLAAAGAESEKSSRPGGVWRLPAPFFITEERVRAARLEDIM